MRAGRQGEANGGANGSIGVRLRRRSDSDQDVCSELERIDGIGGRTGAHAETHTKARVVRMCAARVSRK